MLYENLLKYLNKNWFHFNGNLLFNNKYSVYGNVDFNNVTELKTCYGNFFFTKKLVFSPDIFERNEEFIIDDFKKSDVVLDILGNIGEFSIKVSENVKQIYSVEPFFEEEIAGNIKINKIKNISIIPYALSDKEELEVNILGKKRMVNGLNLTKIVDLCPIKPNILKLDCNGNEWCIKPNELECFRIIEGRIYKVGKRRPENFMKMLIETGFNVGFKWYDNKNLIIHARRYKEF